MIDKLRSQGWSEQELIHLQRHYSPVKESAFLLILVIFLLFFSAFVISYAYALLSLLLRPELFYAVIALTGISLGAVFGVLLVDIDRLDRYHHIILLISIPLISGFGMYLAFLDIHSSLIPGSFIHDAVKSSLIYSFSFLLPYMFWVIYQWNLKIVYSN